MESKSPVVLGPMGPNKNALGPTKGNKKGRNPSRNELN
jgi:hypothetical protein